MAEKDAAEGFLPVSSAFVVAVDASLSRMLCHPASVGLSIGALLTGAMLEDMESFSAVAAGAGVGEL